jgi:hypothetical protein
MKWDHSLTAISGGIARVLITPVKVGSAFDPKSSTPALKDFTGIWDTGATGTVITQRVIDECGLKPISMAKAHSASGEYITEVYLVCILLPNGVGFSNRRVTRGTFSGGDMLIGMDIITKGDFVITNFQGRTCFTFRIPSCERIDFTGRGVIPPNSPPPPLVQLHAGPKVGRNDKCPCGSGKKFKHCCGSGKPPQPPPTPPANPII